jgi:hypothetical protein
VPAIIPLYGMEYDFMHQKNGFLQMQRRKDLKNTKIQTAYKQFLDFFALLRLRVSIIFS